MSVQLGMLGVPDKKGRPFRRRWWMLRFGSVPFPPSTQELRQMAMLTADTHELDGYLAERLADPRWATPTAQEGEQNGSL